MSLGTEWGRSPSGLSTVRPTVTPPPFLTPSALPPVERPPHSLQGSEHPPLLPPLSQSPFSALGGSAGLALVSARTRGPCGSQCYPWRPAGSRRLCEGHPTRPSPAGSRPPGALSFTGTSLCLTSMGALVLWNGHGRRGGGGWGDSGGKGCWMAKGPRGFSWIIRTPQAESQGRLD